MKTTLCTHPGCLNPRHKQNTLCRVHLSAYQRRKYYERRGVDTVPDQRAGAHFGDPFVEYLREVSR